MTIHRLPDTERYSATFMVQGKVLQERKYLLIIRPCLAYASVSPYLSPQRSGLTSKPASL